MWNDCERIVPSSARKSKSEQNAAGKIEIKIEITIEIAIEIIIETVIEIVIKIIIEIIIKIAIETAIKSTCKTERSGECKERWQRKSNQEASSSEGIRGVVVVFVGGRIIRGRGGNELEETTDHQTT